MSLEHYTAVERDAGYEPVTLDRREMLKLLGSGIIILIPAPEGAAFAQGRRRSRYPENFNAFLQVGADGHVTGFSGKIEMGQGIHTSFAQMLADELDVSLSAVDMVMGDTARCPADMATVGSRSTTGFGPALRAAGAQARAVLLELASEHLSVPRDRLTVENGVVFERGNPDHSVSYGRLARGRRIERRLDERVRPKSRAEHRICGRGALRADAVDKVTGKAQYAGDIRLPGMLYARILRPPIHGARLDEVNTAEAEAIDGVQVVRDEDLIAVLHEHPDVADMALARIEAGYSRPSMTVDNTTIFEHLVQSAPPPETVASAGSLDEGRRRSARTFEATYLNHYVAHAPVETHTALAQIEGNTATVWVSTQAPNWVQSAVAGDLGMPPANVRVITPFVGGGFGGKTSNRQAAEAARLAQLVGKPVQVAWTRAEEFFHDTFRPAAVIKVSSGLDSADKMVCWDYENFFAGSRSSEPFYDIPHHRVLARGSWGGRSRGGGVQAHPFSVGAWRGPGSNTNVFAMESQVDIMAEAAGMDPLTFRLRNLSNERMRRVLEAAADRFGQRWATAPSGFGFGVACTDYHNTYVATMAQVSVHRETGHVQVKRVVCAQDTGEVINPAGVRLQVEGCVTMGLGYALTEEVRFRGGNVLDKNFDTYQIPRFSWLPQIEVVLVDNHDLPPQGCGEPAITTMGAVIANAVYDAVGARMFELPMTPERITAAVQALNAPA
ncbi:MAG: xanthine dehydrogenase family protein molybdopterin-binding subunit [Planctomycetota bacterium]|jgi:isoquinoline 1-oxidoreductase